MVCVLLAVVPVVAFAAWLGWWRGGRASAREVVLARRRERARYSRLLHDRVLQTLEILAVSPEIRDATLRGHLADEVAWLRRLVEDGIAAPGRDLVAELARCLHRRKVVPDRVRFDPGPRRELPDLPPAAVEALVGAVTEALTNAAKYAPQARVVVRVRARRTTVVVTVTDDGPGVGPDDLANPGFGLTHSIGGRMAAVGGTGRCYPARGGGTVVELTVSARRARPAIPRPGTSAT